MDRLRVFVLAALMSFSSWCLAETVDINSADAQTIAMHVKGVGPRKAEAIVAYRQSHGGFKDVGELAKVKGIGDSILVMNKDVLVAEESR